MTQKQSLALVIIGGMTFMVVSLVGLYLLGVPGTGLSLGALIPLAVTCHGATRVLARDGQGASQRRH